MRWRAGRAALPSPVLRVGTTLRTSEPPVSGPLSSAASAPRWASYSHRSVLAFETAWPESSASGWRNTSPSGAPRIALAVERERTEDNDPSSETIALSGPLPRLVSVLLGAAAVDLRVSVNAMYAGSRSSTGGIMTALPMRKRVIAEYLSAFAFHNAL